jgi:hypothetical protein
MIFTAKNAFILQWTLVDSNGNPINNAVVLATLYVGRSRSDPDDIPGTAVNPINNVTLVYVAASNGVYQAAIPATLDPPASYSGQPYMIVVDASVSSVAVYHAEEPATVLPFPVDLTTLEAVKDELTIPQSNTTADSVLEQYITGFSQSVINETGIQSFNIPQLMNETRNGNGNYQMYVKMRPIVNVSAVIVNGVTIPAAGVWPSWGWFIADDAKSIWIRQAGSPVGVAYYPSGGSQTRIPSSPGFSRGVGNVQLSYYAGYTNVPYDLELAARRGIATYYRRMQTLDLASKGLASGGTTATTRYRDWKVPPEVECVIQHYRRLAII